MKSVATIATLVLCLASCATGERPIYETEDGYARRSSSSEIDRLRGAHPGRDAEQMRFANNIIRKARPHRYTEMSGPPPLVKCHYTGRVKIYIWRTNNQTRYTAMRETYSPTTGRAGGWQGPNPPTGFYGWKKGEEIIITNFNETIRARLRAEGINI